MSGIPQPGDPARSGVVDAHVHLWDPDLLPYPWLEGSPLRRRVDRRDLVAAAPPGASFVVVQADTSADRAVDEVRWVTSLFAGGPGLLGIVAYAPVERGGQLRPMIDVLAAAGPVVGVRRLLHDEPPGFLAGGGLDAGLDVLREVGLPFDLCVRAHQLEETADLVDRHPGQQFVLDHLGKPRVGDPAAVEPWRRAMERLAAHPGVVVKLSGLAGELVPGAALESARPYLLTALELFGPHRVLYGSDWPVMTLATRYADWRRLVDEVLSELDPAARADVLGGNARRVYRPPGAVGRNIDR